MTGIFEVITAVADLFASVGFNAYKEPVGTVDSPAVIVTLGPGQPDSSMDGDSDDYVLVADLFFTAGPQGMENLYEYLNRAGDRSLVTLFKVNEDLDGLVDWARISSWDKPNRVVMANGTFYHVEIQISVGVS